MSSALFGSSARASSKNIVEFRAGKMFRKEKMVHPDKRRGLIYIHQADDSLMHFCWKDRTSGSVEEDLIIFPDDVEFRRVKSCNNQRIFVLSFKSNNRLLFFWMQEPKPEKDDEYCKKVNEYLNNPPTPGTQRSSSSTPNAVLRGSDLSNLQNSDLGNIIGKISQQQLMQLLGSGMPSLASLLATPNSSGGRSSSGSGSTSTSTTSASASTTATTSSSATATTATPTSGTTSASSRSGIQLSDLQNILSGMSVPSTNEVVPVDLTSVMTAETLQPILSNPEFVEQLKPFLPETGGDLPTAEQLRGTVTSPQFQQAVGLFTSALQSGELGPLISQFGLGDDAVLAASCSDMEAFVKALSKKDGANKDKPKETKKSGKDQDKDEDDAMALD